MKTKLTSAFSLQPSAFAFMAALVLFTASWPARSQTTNWGFELSFDGTNDYVRVAPNPALDLTNGTVEFWVKPDGLEGNACILANRGYPIAETRYSIHLSTNTIGLWNGLNYCTVPFTNTAGQWYHVAVVLSPTNAQFFTNGFLLGATTNGINTTVTNRPVIIGAATNKRGSL